MSDVAKKAPKGWKNVGVELPPSIVAILTAAGGTEAKFGGMPRAMASILGALPWIAVQLFKSLPEDEYKAFAGAVRAQLQQVWQIISKSSDPVVTAGREPSGAK
jgi:hypothetical protein